MQDVEGAVMTFLAEIPVPGPVASDTLLMEQGLLDSTGLVRLIMFLESEFKITIEDAEVVPESFASPAAIAAFIERKTAA